MINIDPDSKPLKQEGTKKKPNLTVSNILYMISVKFLPNQLKILIL